MKNKFTNLFKRKSKEKVEEDENEEDYAVNNITYKSLKNNRYFLIFDTLNEKELDNLKYINKDSIVELSFDNSYEYFKVAKRLKEIGFRGDIKFYLKNQKEFDKEMNNYFEELKDMNIVIGGYAFLSNKYSFSKYIENNKRIDNFIKPALNLSPFEKYLYAYNIVKRYKEFNESSNPNDSRDIYQILDNDYIVCVGFSNFLGILLDKLGIENEEYSQNVDTGLDNISVNRIVLPDDALVKLEGHERRKINLVDPKYNIDGYFIADPTWDNDLKNDSYVYALMTNSEYVLNYRYNAYQRKDVFEIFCVDNLDEFYKKINIYLDKTENSEEKLIYSMLDEFKKLDNNFYKEVISKFPKVNDIEISMIPTIENNVLSNKDIKEIFFFIGNHIIKKSNNIISGETLKEGITVIYRDVLGFKGKQLEEIINEIMEYNKERYKVCFPKRYVLDKDDNLVSIMSEHSKFDENESKKM